MEMQMRLRKRTDNSKIQPIERPHKIVRMPENGQTKNTQQMTKREYKTHPADITGMRFGRLVAIEPVGYNNQNRVMWRCKCDCGGEKAIERNNLILGKTRSCGCLRSERVTEMSRSRRFKDHFRRDISGARFGRLVAIKEVTTDADNEMKWLCACDCGNETIVTRYNLISRRTRSCGCIRVEHGRELGKSNTKTKPTCENTL